MSAPGRTIAAYAFLAPALLVIAVFFFVPVAASVLLSLTDFDIYAIASRANLRFVGGANYAHLLRDPVFWVAVRNTVYFVAIGGPPLPRAATRRRTPHRTNQDAAP